MNQRTTVATTQDFLLIGCHSEQFSINFSASSLSADITYTVYYTYPNNTTQSVVAEFMRKNQLLVKNPPEFDHPCTVNVKVCANDSEQCLTKFPLDLVSPVEYLFRKYSLKDNEMSSQDKMTGALLAMSLSYYYVMEEQVKMERRADKILSTLLTCHGNTEPLKHITSLQSAMYKDNIKEFAKHHQLQCTLQCLPDPLDMYDFPPKHPSVDRESSEIPAPDIPQEEYYAPLMINTRNTTTDDICRSLYTPLTNRTTTDHMAPMNNDGKITKSTTDTYEIPNHNTRDLTLQARRSTAVQPPKPYARRKMERAKSLESIIDKDPEYTYVDPDAIQSRPSAISQPRPRPPRPPPPRRAASPIKPPVMQRTIPAKPLSPIETSTPSGPRKDSAISPPTPKQRTINQWFKDKH